MEENVQDWREEAEAVVKDIENHVKKAEVAGGNAKLIYLNLTTIEGKKFCIELSASGFRVVGKSHNEKSTESEDYYETPYSLLNRLSPGFAQSFRNELVEKLKELE